MNFLRTYIRFDDQEIIRKFESEVDIIFENSKAMGIEEIILEETRKEGKMEGLEKGKVLVVYNCWKEGTSADFTAKITELPLEKVHELFLEFSAKETLK